MEERPVYLSAIDIMNMDRAMRNREYNTALRIITEGFKNEKENENES